MTMPYVQTGLIEVADQADVIQVKNYGATDIADGSALIIDATNLDTTQGLLAVTTTTTADSLARIGIAKGIIPAGGQGECVVAGFVRGKSASTAFTVGQIVGTTTTAGQVAVTSTAGATIGFIAKAETTTTPLIYVSFK